MSDMDNLKQAARWIPLIVCVGGGYAWRGLEGVLYGLGIYFCYAVIVMAVITGLRKAYGDWEPTNPYC